MSDTGTHLSLKCNGWKLCSSPYNISMGLLPSEARAHCFAVCCSKSHIQRRRRAVYEGNVVVGWFILLVFHADCHCASDAFEWDLQTQTNQTPHTPTLWVPPPIGLNAVVRQWRCIDRAWLRLLWGKKRSRKHTHALTQTAICHGCLQPGHHLPLQMGQNTQNNRPREKERDEQGIIAWGADTNQWLSFCLRLSRSLYPVRFSTLPMAHRWDGLLRCWLSINSWMSLHVCQLVRKVTPVLFN